MATILRGFMVLVPTGRRFGIFKDAGPDEVPGLRPGEHGGFQVAEVEIEGRRGFVLAEGSETVVAEDVASAAHSLVGEGHVVAITPYVEHPMWKNASMPARLFDGGASATPVEDAACAVALVLAGWGWDEREIIPVTVDGNTIYVRLPSVDPGECEVMRNAP